MNMIVGFPCDGPGGLDAPLSDHFGHCEAFTLVAVEDGRIASARVLPNPSDGHGHCHDLVNGLAQRGVRVLVANGMGRGPLRASESAGIQVLHGGGAALVRDAAQALVEGRLRPFSPAFVCGHSTEQRHEA